MISIEQLTQRYHKSRLALDHLDLEVEEGEILGLIGPNGAGKTTTIKVLATLLYPTFGEVEIAGIDVLAKPEAVRWKIGYLSDTFGVYEDMRVHQFLEFFASVYKIPAANRETLVNDLLELVDLRSLAREPIRNLSRGTQQRLGLARILVHDPEVLLLDEPASGLDPRARVEVREFLKELRNMGKTVVISSHILADLADICDRVAIIDHGKLQFHGTLDDLRAKSGLPQRLRIGVDRDESGALKALQQHPDVRRVDRVDGEFELTLQSDAVIRAELLRDLIDQGLAIHSFRSLDSDLEAAFIALTRTHEEAAEEAQA